MTRRSQTPLLRSALLGFSSLALLVAPSLALADNFLGDLVYCDLDANGVLDGADYPLNGVNVHVVCNDITGDTCADVTTTTGAPHPDVKPAEFVQVCGAVAGYDPAGSFDGRYLFALADAGCHRFDIPWTCTVTVDPTTLPAECNVLLTPREEGFPIDGNQDGDLCDVEDGPFPEGDRLGFDGTLKDCSDSPDPFPMDGTFLPEITPVGNRCALYNDFAYTPADEGSGATRTPGFWKNHPVAIEQGLPLSFCGQEITQVCDAVALLSRRGSGINKFTRHGVAATLNCDAFGCPAEIADAIASGSAACEDGTPFNYTTTGTLLDLFNNSGKDIEDELNAGPADPKFCR